MIISCRFRVPGSGNSLELSSRIFSSERVTGARKERNRCGTNGDQWTKRIPQRPAQFPGRCGKSW